MQTETSTSLKLQLIATSTRHQPQLVTKLDSITKLDSSPTPIDPPTCRYPSPKQGVKGAARPLPGVKGGGAP